MLKVTVPVLAILLFLATPAAGSQQPAFDWTMPEQLGKDLNEDGLIDYPDTARQVATGPFTVTLKVRDDLCLSSSHYSWSVAEEPAGSGKGLCQLRRRFVKEGTYKVSLEIASAGGDVLHFERPIIVQDWLVVSIGDSVASGEGNPDRPGFLRSARWQSPRCHRSTLAAPAQAALALERADPHTSTTFVHLACSGAKVQSGLLEPYAGADPPDDADPATLAPQISELESIASQRPIDAVLLSVGANDVYFGPLAGFCIRVVNCISKRFDPADPSRVAEEPAEPPPDVISKALRRLEASYQTLGKRLAEIVEPSRVFISDYFDPTHDADGSICHKIGIPLLPRYYIDADEAAWAESHLLGPLNIEIAEAAQREGWTEVTGIAESFRQHGYCAGRKSWIRTLTRSLVTQSGAHASSRLLGALHPNEEGHKAIAALLYNSLQNRLYAGAGPAERPQSGADGVLVEPMGGGGTPASGNAESCLEGAVRLGLIAVFMATLLTAALLLPRLRRNGSAASGNPNGEPPKVRSDLPTTWQGKPVVKAFGEMIEQASEWVHRRVESIEFIDERTIRRRVSVDFTPIAFDRSGETIAPIAMLAKGVLTHFDLRDEQVASVPLRTADENATLSTQLMLMAAEEATGQLASERLQILCWTIARGEPAEADVAIAEISDRLHSGAEPASLGKSKKFLELTTTFAARFPIVVALADCRRRVLKFASDEAVSKGPERLARLGIAPATFHISVPELGDAGSRHIEFVTSDGLETFDARVLGVQPDGQPVRDRADVQDGRHAHLMVSKVAHQTRGLAEVRLWAQRRGILAGGPLLAAFAAVALTAAWFALPELAENSRDAASLLLAVPAALGTYLGARDPHPLAAALLRGARILVFAAGPAGFIAAGGMALGYSAETMRVVLGASAVLSWLTVAGLTTVYFAPRAPRWNSRPEGL